MCAPVFFVGCWLSFIAVVQLLIAANRVSIFRVLIVDCRCRLSMKILFVGAQPCICKMQLVNFSGRKDPANSCHLFFPNSSCQEYKSTEKVEKYIYIFVHFCVTSQKECTRIQRTFLVFSSLLLSEELPHGAGQRFEPGTYFAVCMRFQLIATLIPDKNLID